MVDEVTRPQLKRGGEGGATLFKLNFLMKRRTYSRARSLLEAMIFALGRMEPHAFVQGGKVAHSSAMQVRT